MDGFVDEDYGEGYALEDGGKKCSLYLVDASPKMFEKRNLKCPFSIALSAIRLQMVNKAVTSSLGEYTGILFLNTLNKTHTIEHIYVMQELDRVSVERVKAVDKLIFADDVVEEFTKICGGHGHCDYSEAIFACTKRVLSKQPKFHKKIVYYFTNEEDPFKSNSQHETTACKNVNDLRSHDVTFSVYPLIENEDGFSFDILKKLDPNVYENWCSFDEILSDIPRRQYTRRNISNVEFIIGNGVKLSIGTYTLFRPDNLPQPLPLDAEKNELVEKLHIRVNKETGEEMLLFDEEIIQKTSAGDELLSFSGNEVEKLRRLTPPGLLLLGFKPMSCLKIAHHVRSAQYVFPLDKDILGSTRLYRALYEVCMQRKTVIICRYTQQLNVPPKLVALVPQAPVNKEDSNFNYCYPGFHLVYLPFAEEKRDLTNFMTKSDGKWPKADAKQIDCARNFVQKLTAKYYPEKFVNPVIQQHYKRIEAFAIGYAEVKEVDDQIQPYFIHGVFRERVKEELDRFRQATLSEEYNPEATKIAKQRRGDDTKKFQVPAKKYKWCNESLEYLACNQLLTNLKVSELRVKACQANIPIRANAKKSEIVDSIQQHFQKI